MTPNVIADPPTMRAAVVRAPDSIGIEEIALPELGPQEVLVKVMVTGICGSDLPRVLGRAAHSYPIVLGHEFAGVVVKLGAGVTNVAVDTRVAGVPLMPCHDCVDCDRGNFSQCSRYSFLGSRTNGSWAEFVSVPATNLIAIPDSVTFEDAAMIEPSAVALHAFHLAAPSAGATVAIIGAGNIGQLAIQWARILGAAQITVFDIDERRLDAASRLGADLALFPDAGADAWRAHTGGRGFDLVVETAGVPSSLPQALALVANKGRVVLVGTPTRDVTVPPKVFEQLNRKEATIVGSWMSYSAPFPGGEWADTLEELQRGTLSFPELVAARFPLDDIGAAFDLYRAEEPVRGKILLYDADYYNAREDAHDET